jgi:hypothetical protein
MRRTSRNSSKRYGSRYMLLSPCLSQGKRFLFWSGVFRFPSQFTSLDSLFLYIQLFTSRHPIFSVITSKHNPRVQETGHYAGCVKIYDKRQSADSTLNASRTLLSDRQTLYSSLEHSDATHSPSSRGPSCALSCVSLCLPQLSTSTPHGPNHHARRSFLAHAHHTLTQLIQLHEPGILH